MKRLIAIITCVLLLTLIPLGVVLYLDGSAPDDLPVVSPTEDDGGVVTATGDTADTQTTDTTATIDTTAGTITETATTTPTDGTPSVSVTRGSTHGSEIDSRGTTASANTAPPSLKTTQTPTVAGTTPTVSRTNPTKTTAIPSKTKPTKATTASPSKTKPKKPPVIIVSGTKTTTTTPDTTQRTQGIMWADYCESEVAVLITHGKNMKCHSCLIQPLRNAHPDYKIAVRAEPFINMSFVYEGKTMEEYYKEYRDSGKVLTRLQKLLKNGDELKYGEALYTTGTPDGTRWAQSYYESTIDTIGEDLISKYIVNGEFLKEEVQSAIDSFQYETDFFEIFEACKKQVATDFIEILNRLEIEYKTQSHTADVLFFATYEELTNLSYYELEGLHFHGAIKGYYFIDE